MFCANTNHKPGFAQSDNIVFHTYYTVILRFAQRYRKYCAFMYLRTLSLYFIDCQASILKDKYYKLISEF